MGVLLALISLISGCAKETDSGKTAFRTAQDSLTIELHGENGKSVLEITVSSHKVDYLETAAGAFVRGIDSLSSNNNLGWLYSVNGKMADMASNKYITNDTDIIRWHYRKM
jgi:hypothetical protein